MSIIDLCINIDCAGCESKLRKALLKLDGVDEVDIDMARQKVTVIGWVDQKKVLRAVKKTGMKAVLWADPYNVEYHPYTPHYYHHLHAAQAHSYATHGARANYYSSPSPSYSYYQHGYGHDSSMHGYYYQRPVNYTIFEERAQTMFSDDNTSACSIM